MNLLDLLRREPTLQELPFEGSYPIALNGLQGQSSLLTAAYLCKQSNHKGILVTRQGAGGKEILGTLRALLGEKVYYLPERDFVFDDYAARSMERENEHAEVLKKMRSSDYTMIVAPLSALLMPVPPPEEAEEQGLLLKVGITYEPEALAEWLAERGYTAFELVEGCGTFARRGGILDIFSPNYPDPLRIEFFGDEIDRIVFFDVLTQRTLETVEEAELVACHSRKGEERRLEPILKGLEHPGAKADLERLQNGRSVATDRYLPLLYPELYTPLDLHRGLLFLEEYGTQQKIFSFMDWQLKEEMERHAEKGEYMADGAYFLSKEDFEARWNGKTVLLSAIAPGVDRPLGALRQLRVLEDHIPFYQEETLLGELKAATEEQYTVVLTGTAARAEELKTALTEGHIPLTDIPKDGAVCCVESPLSFNLRFPEAKLLFLADGNRKAEQIARRKGTHKGEKIRSFNDITPGDLVVHVSHGIGVYKGIRQVENQGVTKD
ncbi:MAG: hypothetical protein IJP27_08135, partial [Clostridia bacterium]|nr:hypothetical protein [Clostridia bacterium]